jgi:hypothetical protein
MSSNSATKVISNVLTGIIIPGIIGLRSNGIAITFLCIDSCPDETNAFGEEFEEEASPPEAAKPPLRLLLLLLFGAFPPCNFDPDALAFASSLNKFFK